MNGTNRNNMFLAIALSALVIFGWQYFVVTPQMKARKSGAIVNVSSIGGKVTLPWLTLYSATKFALGSLTEGLQMELRRDGIHFQGLCYSHATLAAYVGDAVTIRYDPRDLSEIRVFHHEQFLCRAVSEAHAGEVVTLKDIQAARRMHRRALRTTINERIARVVDFLPGHAQSGPPAAAPPPSGARSQTKLRLYQEDEP